MNLTQHARPTGCPVDGHVHFHSLDLVAATLSAAARNFRGITSGGEGAIRGMLLLTQAFGERVFEQLTAGRLPGEWRLEPAADEAETLISRNGAGEIIVIVCGRQVRAQGGLEVLALGTRQEFPDGLSLPDTVRAVRDTGSMAVLPWGFGKWLGSRGRRVSETLESFGVRQLAVGDNGSRMAGWAVPQLLSDAERGGFRVIPGTDPFPFAHDYERVGRFGFFAAAAIDERAPWRSLHAWLDTLNTSPPRFGAPTGPLRFAFNQVGIQFYNRFLRKAAA